MKNLDSIFTEVKEVLEEYSDTFLAKDKYINSKAKQEKPAYHLYGTKEVSLFGKKPEKTYIAGVIKQKNYVSFYFSPIYSHPDDFSDISPELNKFLKGKSCFNLTKFNPDLKKEIKTLLSDGIQKYKEIEWI
ncbi:MAG: hypothetical protein GF317_23240 [Candidatus Lokiarchaeota archaeon]|nr:hypothetical protein [Candidatus Lokiarchaeota archaeon]MBD3202339.1 hypothetical protein [Candidatus Lokiarchaeota archaeon]